jgi:hypothetical protein
MANRVWTWFKKAGHYIGVGITDVNKFLQTSGAMNLLSLLPAGGAVAAGVGVFEKIMGVAAQVETTVTSVLGPSTQSGPQKLAAVVPSAVAELLQLAAAAGMKVTDTVKLGQIAASIGSATADFWNILEPVNSTIVNLPVPPAVSTSPAPVPVQAVKPVVK